MDYKITPEMRKTVKNEIEKRGMRWQQSHRNDLQLISAIYEKTIFEPVFKAVSEDLSRREYEVLEKEKNLESRCKLLDQERSVFEKEKESLTKLSELQNKIYSFAKCVSNYYAILSRMNVPEPYVNNITEVLTEYIRYGLEQEK